MYTQLQPSGEFLTIYVALLWVEVHVTLEENICSAWSPGQFQ